MSGKQLRRFPFYVLLGVGSMTTAVFVAAGCVMDGGFERAWEILLGIRTPFGQAAGLGVALSALGYIAMPTVIGIAAAAGITLFTSKRLSTVEEALVDIKEMTRERPGGKSDGEKGSVSR